MRCAKKGEMGLMAREALDVEVTDVSQEQLNPHGCDPVVCPVGDSVTRFVIRVQGGEIRIQSRLEFVPILQLVNSKDGRADL